MTDNIQKVAQLHDERDDSWYDVYEADAAGGDRVRVEVPRDVREAGNVRKHLLKKGAEVSTLDHSRGTLNVAIQSDATVVHRAGALGWSKDQSCFVGPDYVVGCEDNTIVPPPKNRWTRNMQQHGTLSEWQDLIDCARYSTAMIFCLCATFAAPLMRLLNCPNFGLVLVGPSRCAKSTSQLVGASAFGFGTEEHLPTPKGTSAGLIETAAMFNDHVFTLNELGAAAGDKSQKYDAVLDMTYAFSGGQDAVRHSSWSGSTGTDFKTLALISSEVSPDEWAARAGEGRDPGEVARLIGVPILHNGQPTVFDSFPKMISVGERRPWVAQQFSRFRGGLPGQRGVAYRAFLEALIADPPKYIKNAEEDAADFREDLAGHATSPIARDILAKLAVMYAGGRAAADANVLPFESGVIYKAVRRSCIAALRSLPDPEAELREDLVTLKALLEDVGVIDADEASTRQKRNMECADGYYETEDFGRRYTVRATPTFMSAFPSLQRARRVLDWLDREGFLRHQREHKASLSVEWAQTQVKWPSGTRVRSFVLYFPSGLKVLEKV